MGREANCVCRAGTRSEPVRALLEATELRLRGATLKLRASPASLQGLKVEGEDLAFSAEGQDWRLALGAEEAGKWLHKLTSPPPTLAGKLGIHAGKPAFVVGAAPDPALAGALQGAVTPDPAQATVLVAVVESDQALEEALAVHAGMPCAGVWMVYRKGSGSTPGDQAIRHLLRSRGYADHKTCAVSAEWTATRYARKPVAT